MRPVHRLVLLGFLALTPPGWAQTPAPVSTDAQGAQAAPPAAPRRDIPDFSSPEPVEQESLGWTLLRTLLVLGIVVLVAYLTLNVGLRKLLGGRAFPGSSGTLLQVLERRPLDPKSSLFVVKVAGEYYLIGGGEGPLSLIAKLDAEAVEKAAAQKVAPGPGPQNPFWLKLLSRRGGPPPSP